MTAKKTDDGSLPGDLDFQAGQADVARKSRQIRAAVKAHATDAGEEAIHGRPAVLYDPMFYPAHDERTESAEYKKVHDDLTKTKDLPCLVCGVRNSILKSASRKADPEENPYGATQMETHHHIIEWALANAIDPDRFNKALLPNLRAKHADNETYKREAFTAEDIKDWVDHSPDNLWVLCDVHHRHKWVGIHHISYPMWAPQDLLKPAFQQQVASAIDEWEKKHP